jgi:hypothetical protein
MCPFLVYRPAFWSQRRLHPAVSVEVVFSRRPGHPLGRTVILLFCLAARVAFTEVGWTSTAHAQGLDISNLRRIWASALYRAGPSSLTGSLVGVECQSRSGQ